MEKKQFDELKDQLESECKKQINILKKTYALSNNTIKIGDVIEDHCHKIKVEKINVGHGGLSIYPECVYYGPELKKDGSPKKNKAKSSAWQSNIKELE